MRCACSGGPGALNENSVRYSFRVKAVGRGYIDMDRPTIHQSERTGWRGGWTAGEAGCGTAAGAAPLMGSPIGELHLFACLPAVKRAWTVTLHKYNYGIQEVGVQGLTIRFKK